MTENKNGKRITAVWRNGGFSASYDSLVVGSSAVLRLSFCAKNPPLLKAAKRYQQFMRRLFIITSFIFISSCTRTVENHQEIENLQNQISTLQEENKKLKDSLLKNGEEIMFSHLIGIPETPKQKVGRKNKIVMLLHDFDRKLPKYEIFRVVEGKKIKVGESNKTIFDYEFTPTSTEDNRPEFLVKMPYRGKFIEIPGKLILDVEK